MKITEFRKQALANEDLEAQDVKVGDFVYLLSSGLKNDTDFAQQCGYCDDRNHVAICKVVSEMVITDEELLVNEFLPEHEGGSMSEDLDDDVNMCTLTSEQCATFYQLVTKVTTPSGRVVFADRQGFDYTRYLYFWGDFKTMFADEVESYHQEEIQREVDRVNELIALREKAIERVKADFGESVHGLDFCKNIKVILERLHSDVAIKVTISTKCYYERTNIWFASLSADAEERLLATLKRIDRDYMYPTDDDNEWGGCCYRNAFYDVFGTMLYRESLNVSKSPIKRHDK